MRSFLKLTFFSLISTFLLLATSFGQLVGLSYNSQTGENEFRSVDPGTGQSTVLNTFTLESGYSGFFSNPSKNEAYILSGPNQLIRFNLTTGELIGSTEMDVQYPTTTTGGPTGLTVAVSNHPDPTFDLKSLDPLSGETTLITSFQSNGIGQIFADADTAYLPIWHDEILRFDLTSGQPLPSIDFTHPFQNFDLGVNGQIAGIWWNDATQQNEFISVNPETSEVDILNAFSFTGGFYSSFFTDPLAGLAYALSSENDLYTFNLLTGGILNIANLDYQGGNFAVGAQAPDMQEIPEPQTIGMIALSLFTALLGWRRLRLKSLR